jgi:hypothetical protein
MIAVYKGWLKQYLDWFDPDLFEYISAHAAGMKVSTFANWLDSNYDYDYEMQAQIQYDPLLVPLPKMHKKVSTCDEFGVTEEDVFSLTAKIRTQDCHPIVGLSAKPAMTKKINGSVQPIRF